MRNFILALCVSIGTPMFNMGDEYGHTKQGNNNTWCHDSPLNWFLWDELYDRHDLHRFMTKMISFRKTEKLLKRTEFLTSADINWHGHMPFKPDWSSSSRFVAYTLLDPVLEEHLLIAFNASSSRTTIQLPDPPLHKKWFRIVDSAFAPPFDFIEEPNLQPPIRCSYKMDANSALILKAMSI